MREDLEIKVFIDGTNSYIVLATFLLKHCIGRRKGPSNDLCRRRKKVTHRNDSDFGGFEMIVKCYKNSLAVKKSFSN